MLQARCVIEPFKLRVGQPNQHSERSISGRRYQRGPAADPQRKPRNKSATRVCRLRSTLAKHVHVHEQAVEEYVDLSSAHPPISSARNVPPTSSGRPRSLSSPTAASPQGRQSGSAAFEESDHHSSTYGGCGRMAFGKARPHSRDDQGTRHSVARQERTNSGRNRPGGRGTRTLRPMPSSVLPSVFPVTAGRSPAASPPSTPSSLRVLPGNCAYTYWAILYLLWIGQRL